MSTWTFRIIKKTVELAQNKGSITFNIFTPFDERMFFFLFKYFQESFFGRSSKQAMGFFPRLM